MAESKPSLRTYFRSQIAISESRSVYCTLRLRPLCTSGFVTLYHPVCRVRRFAVEQVYFRNGSAIRTHKFTLPLWRALYITAFLTFLLQTTAWKWVLIFYGNHKTEHVIGRLKMCRPSSIYHPVRCRNRDSSLIPYFQFFGPTDNQP